MVKWSLVVVLAMVACGDGPTTGEHDARFSGRWIVDQPFHAGYEATVYEFSRSGAVHALDACDWSGVENDYVTGTVESASGIRCAFGNGWHSDGPNQLVVAGDCEDGRDRAIALSFASDASQNATGTDVQVDSVAQEQGWEHRDFDWQWTRCPAEGCEPVWVCR